ncbi:related to putative arabinase [Phialocephala subalpina]|uniref:Related to putative arabinase n=1 Tax=Phialocephala subalpina TaxID=576137 RepID=A0A1L7WPB9_9HELO|nr:related to putative arabinase [Phialocephala subalpina]
MKLPFLSLVVLGASIWALPSVSPSSSSKALGTRVDASLVGYLGVFFLGNTPDVYFYLSNGNNAFSMKALNGGKPVLIPTLGTGGVRDPSIISGGGTEKGKKWYIVGTDLDIGKGNERLVKVEGNDAGMVWVPDALWDESKGQYLIHWASKFYASSDTSHKGTPGPDMIRYAYTSDFKTFTTPQTFISAAPTSIIDLCILPLPSPQSYIRCLKNETATNVYMEYSTTGLLGTWSRPGGRDSYIMSGVEGPYAWLDNVVPGKVDLLLDYFGGDGYRGFVGSLNGTGGGGDVNVGIGGLTNGNWVEAGRSGWPTGLRHGSVVGVSQQHYDALKAKWT